MDSYSRFALFYDGLTQNVDYAARCEYFLGLLGRFGHSAGKTLDLACGTGSLTLELFKKGVDVFGVDLSEDMLCAASSKAAESGCGVLFVCQHMQKLRLPYKIDTCFCALDSINHLTKGADVLKTFKSVSANMNKGGVFIFDVNTPYKHREVLANNTFVSENEDVFCVWQYTLLEENLVQIDLDFFEYQGGDSYLRSSESFCEKAYEYDEITEMLGLAGFELLGCYGDMTENPPLEKEQRAVYAARKI